MTVIKTWPASAHPLSLPVHRTEDTLSTVDLKAAIQRSITLEKCLSHGESGSRMLGRKFFSLKKDYPGSMFRNMAYFDGPGLVLFILDDPDSHRRRYIVLYHLFPVRRLAVWDTEDAEIDCWSYNWFDMGGKYKQLVVAASLRQPGWAESGTHQNMLEVRSVDISNTDTTGNFCPTEFKLQASSHSRYPYRSVVISSSVCAAMVFEEGLPVIITCMDWITREVTNLLVDAADTLPFRDIPDLTSHIRFGSRDSSDGEIIIIDDWVGILQLCQGESVRYILIPTDCQSKTVDIIPGMPPFRCITDAVVAGCHPKVGDVLRIDGGAAVYTSCLHEPRQLRILMQETMWSEGVVGIATVDFTNFSSKVAQRERKKSGFHEFSDVCNKRAPMTWPEGDYSPVVGIAGAALGCLHETEEIVYLTWYRLPPEPYTSPLVAPAYVHLPIMVERERMELVLLDDAAGVACLQDEESRLWFVRLSGTNIVKSSLYDP